MAIGRKPHTIILREIIKPSISTPFHLRTYNLSLLDQRMPRNYVPVVLFYPNQGHSPTSLEKVSMLKNSLSEVLSRYYLLAGRFDTAAGNYVDCNDMGVDFVQAHFEGSLSNFLNGYEQESLDDLFPDGLVWGKSQSKVTYQRPVLIQLNHFTCGGISLAMSMLHKVGDAATLGNFAKYWADVRKHRYSRKDEQVVPIDPHILKFHGSTFQMPEITLDEVSNCVTKRLVFPNSKINDLKVKVMSIVARTGIEIKPPTRIEVLTSLLYKQVVKATTSNLSTFKPSILMQTVNMRNVMVEPLPQTTVGNFVLANQVLTKEVSDLKLDTITSKLQKGKMKLRSLRNWDMITEREALTTSLNGEVVDASVLPERVFSFSSMCNFQLEEIDFGWGGPIRATVGSSPSRNFILFVDAPSGDGIEAFVTLDKEDMKTLENDEELLSFC